MVIILWCLFGCRIVCVESCTMGPVPGATRVVQYTEQIAHELMRSPTGTQACGAWQ